MPARKSRKTRPANQKAAKKNAFRSHVFIAECMNYDCSFRGNTQKEAHDKAIEYCRALIDGETEFVILDGVGTYVGQVNHPEVEVRDVKPDDDNGIVISNQN